MRTKRTTKKSRTVRSSTLAALSAVLAFVALGAASTAATPVPHLIASFNETNHSIVSDFISSRGSTSITAHEAPRSDAFNFVVTSNAASQSVANRRYAINTIRYPAATNVTPTTIPSKTFIQNLASATTVWSKTGKFSWTPPSFDSRYGKTVDVIVFTGVQPDSSSRVVMQDYAIIRLTLFDAVTASPATPVSVVKNLAFLDGNATNPTAVANATKAKIGSFIIQGPSNESVLLTRVTLKDSSASFPLGVNFQNMFIRHDSLTLGTAIGGLNNTATQRTYAFTVTPPVTIAPNATYVVDVYADVTGAPRDVDRLVNPGVIVDSVTATGVTSLNDVSNELDVNLQATYVRSSGVLTVTVDPNTPAPAQQVMGSTNIPLARFVFAADGAEDIAITSLAFSDLVTMGASGTFKNMRLYDKFNNPVSSVINPVIVYNPNAVFVPFDGLRITVPKNTSMPLTLKGDVVTFADGAVSGSKHTFFMDATDYNLSTAGMQSSVGAMGVQSGSALITAGRSLRFSAGAGNFNQVANSMTVYRTKVTVTFAADSPTGVAPGSSAQTVAKFNVANTANVGNYDARLERLNPTLDFVGFFNSGSTPQRELKVYKDSQTQQNQVASTMVSSAASGHVVTSMTFVPVTLSAGVVRPFVVTLNTTDAQSNAHLAVNLEQGNVHWSDGVSNGIDVVETLPQTAHMLSY